MANDQENRKVNPNTRAAIDVTTQTEAMDVSVGSKQEKVETEGITIRGCGAATKGTKAIGPMA
jgi:hypothetical protein